MDSTSTTGFAPRFSPLDERRGMHIIDPVQEVQCTFLTHEAVTPSRCDPSTVPFCFPVDSVARIKTNHLVTTSRVNVHIRDQHGNCIASATNMESVSVDTADSYTIEITSQPVKLYLYAESRVLALPDDNSTEVVFPDVETVFLGARSFHDQPARAIKTTSEPGDLMRAISEFGSALKTTSCERSWPTLRGHPPLLEHGNELHIPDGASRPETGVQIEIPPKIEYIYPVAPLAYYLGAKVQPGEVPQLTTTDGFTYSLEKSRSFEQTVEEVLKQVFTLDCLTRTEGYYNVPLDERRRAEHELGLNFNYQELYDASLAKQLSTYLSVPFADVQPIIPQWRLTATITPKKQYTNVLPYLASELALIKIDRDTETASPKRSSSGHSPDQTTNHPSAVVTEFLRSGAGTGSNNSVSAAAGALNGDFIRGTTANTESTTDEIRSEETHSDKGGENGGVAWPDMEQLPGENTHVSQDELFHVSEASTATQTYIGEGIPVGANKGSKASYDRKLTLRNKTPSRISVAVICNDAEMREEMGVSNNYGAHDLFDFNISIHERLTQSELAEIFQSGFDFVHFIGHVDSRGMQCSDGYLDATTIDDVDTSAFFLNACRSFKQGEALITAGAIAGISTLENVHNTPATEVGHNLAQLLNAGWPLDGALELVQDDAVAGRHYLVLGDGSVELVNPDGGVPTWIEIDPRKYQDAETYEVTIYAYPTQRSHLGTIYTPYIGANDTPFLGAGEIDTFTVSQEELREFLSLGKIPVQINTGQPSTTSSMQWSDEIHLEQTDHF